jgi:hypothetical protein
MSITLSACSRVAQTAVELAEQQSDAGADRRADQRPRKARLAREPVGALMPRSVTSTASARCSVVNPSTGGKAREFLRLFERHAVLPRHGALLGQQRGALGFGGQFGRHLVQFGLELGQTLECCRQPILVDRVLTFGQVRRQLVGEGVGDELGPLRLFLGEEIVSAPVLSNSDVTCDCERRCVAAEVDRVGTLVGTSPVPTNSVTWFGETTDWVLSSRSRRSAATCASPRRFEPAPRPAAARGWRR